MSLSLIAALMLGAGTPSGTRAQAEGVFNRASEEYQAKSYEAALADFARSYELLPLPEVLFDIAQCQRRLGRWEEAAKTYARFLDGAPRAQNRGEAERDLAEVKAKLAQEPPPSHAVPLPEVVVVEPSPTAVAPEASVSETAPRRSLPQGAWWLGGSGAVVLVAGGVCVALAGTELGGGSPQSGVLANRLTHSQAQTYATTGNVGEAGLATGAALLAGSVLWGWLGATK